MRRTLGAPVLVVLLTAALGAGCGSQDESADDPGSPTGSSAPTTPAEPGDGDGQPSTPPTDGEIVGLLSETAAGGEVDDAVTYVDDAAAWGEFLAQFSSPDLVDEIRSSVAGADPGPQTRLAAATVMVGCDVPPGVAITAGAESAPATVTPQKVADPLQECFAPVTTVAVVALPAG